MKNHIKKGIELLFIMSLFLFAVSGCGAQKEKTVVTFQSWNPADTGPESPIYKIINSFEEENPDIDINYVYVGSDLHTDRLRINLVEGDGPDVFGLSAGASFDEFRDFEENLTPYCEDTWGPEWEKKFLDSCLGIIKDENGDTLGLPLGQTFAGFLWADVNMMKKYGCDVPSNYKEMQETCGILRENGLYPLAIGAGDSWVNLDMWMTIAADVDRDALYDAIEGKVSFETDSIIESFEIWQNSFTNGVFQDKAIRMPLYDKVNDMFQREGSIPMFVNGSWAMNMYTLRDTKTYENFNSDDSEHEVFLIDWDNDGIVSPVTASADVILCMNPESKVKDAAFRWMDYMVNEGQKILVNEYLEYMPTLKDLEIDVKGLSADGEKNLRYIIENGKNNVAGTRGIKYPDLNLAVCRSLKDLALGEVTPEEAAKEIQEVSRNTIR